MALETVCEGFRRHATDYASQAVRFARADTPAPLPAILGWDLPPEAARIVAEAVDHMIARQQVTEPWQVVETWAAEYLATASDTGGDRRLSGDAVPDSP
jgi:hypothetical protein